VIVSEELIQAAAQGKIGDVIRLMKEGVNINYQGRTGWTPLMVSIEHGEYHCVRIFVRGGAEIERIIFGHTALAHAVDNSIDTTIQTGGKQGDEPTDIIRLLLEAGANPEPGLRVARAYRSEKIVKLLSEWSWNDDAAGLH
jgi:ankyrin repeat protein